MSRSRRKTMVRGLTTANTERGDKLYWHRSWRRRERLKLALLTPENADEHLTLLPNEVMDIWSMAKDGKVPYSEETIRQYAQEFADWRGRTPQERAALERRWRYRRFGK
jgi:hypothetical protein